MKNALLKMLGFYQKKISPLFPPRCRYYPTCSQYAILAIKKYGPFRGSLKAIWRILRCNPFSKGGYDPVPEDPNVTLAAAFGKPLLTYTKKGAAAACRRIATRLQGMPVKIEL